MDLVVAATKDGVLMVESEIGELDETTVLGAVKFGFDVREAYLANLSEKEQKKLTVKNNSVTLDVKPFEIITLMVK